MRFSLKRGGRSRGGPVAVHIDGFTIVADCRWGQHRQRVGVEQRLKQGNVYLFHLAGVVITQSPVSGPF
jgi:hypothetical protein